MTFKILSEGAKGPIGHKFVKYHVVFVIKVDDFRHEAELVVGGQTTKTPVTIMYAGVVSRETVHIALL